MQLVVGCKTTHALGMFSLINDTLLDAWAKLAISFNLEIEKIMLVCVWVGVRMYVDVFEHNRDQTLWPVLTKLCT